jgi:hypothetical protein
MNELEQARYRKPCMTRPPGAARSSGRKLSGVAGEVAAGFPCRRANAAHTDPTEQPPATLATLNKRPKLLGLPGELLGHGVGRIGRRHVASSPLAASVSRASIARIVDTP